MAYRAAKTRSHWKSGLLRPETCASAPRTKPSGRGTAALVRAASGSGHGTAPPPPEKIPTGLLARGRAVPAAPSRGTAGRGVPPPWPPSGTGSPSHRPGPGPAGGARAPGDGRNPPAVPLAARHPGQARHARPSRNAPSARTRYRAGHEGTGGTGGPQSAAFPPGTQPGPLPGMPPAHAPAFPADHGRRTPAGAVRRETPPRTPPAPTRTHSHPPAHAHGCRRVRVTSGRPGRAGGGRVRGRAGACGTAGRGGGRASGRGLRLGRAGPDGARAPLSLSGPARRGAAGPGEPAPASRRPRVPGPFVFPGLFPDPVRNFAQEWLCDRSRYAAEDFSRAPARGGRGADGRPPRPRKTRSSSTPRGSADDHLKIREYITPFIVRAELPLPGGK